MVTDFRCWWQNHYVGDFFRYVGDFLNVFNRSPTSQTCHQHIWSRTSMSPLCRYHFQTLRIIRHQHLVSPALILILLFYSIIIMCFDFPIIVLSKRLLLMKNNEILNRKKVNFWRHPNLWVTAVCPFNIYKSLSNARLRVKNTIRPNSLATTVKKFRNY